VRKRLRDFESIAAFFSDREIEELQAAVDARREARAARTERPDDISPQDGCRGVRVAMGPGIPDGGRRAG
jgi:hypothetical protein